MERNVEEMTLAELTEFLEEKGGHLEGRGDGTVKWEQNDDR